VRGNERSGLGSWGNRVMVLEEQDSPGQGNRTLPGDTPNPGTGPQWTTSAAFTASRQGSS
jgi:hypothetical protein